MTLKNTRSSEPSGAHPFSDAYDYLTDAFQRSVLFMDVLRKRGNIYFEHRKNGKPPVLTFGHDLILEGKALERPVNFSLVQIRDRRHKDKELAGGDEKRKTHVPPKPHDPKKRPIIIVDPRAGHGPGIGGSKRDSEIGMALEEGHPVYFLIFTADPVPGQTLADVHAAQIRFIEEVIRRHPDAEKPAIIGNCQAGWAAALVGADRPDLTGPLVFNGAPLSYWAGRNGTNPMRYRGGLFGGVWLTSLWSDLGNGIFDGANLVAGFEDLNPANTFWKKLYHLYANVDTEENRFLEFERWWNGFFRMNREEIHYIVENLFVGNKLEDGRLVLDGRPVDLKNIKAPILVFASKGDNITPPQQALNWVVKVFKSVEEIRQNQQVVVYMVHETIGHLGIFVSGAVSRKEHREIIAGLDLMEYLAPGLYEMIIEPNAEDGRRSVRFESRSMEDILTLDDGLADEDAFEPVAAISEINDGFYRSFVSPWVRAAVGEPLAETIRALHPLRIPLYVFSDVNPAMRVFEFLSPMVKENRRAVSQDNPYVQAEQTASRLIAESLDLFREIRDLSQEFMFKTVYGNPWVLSFFKKPSPEQNENLIEAVCRPEWLEKIDIGGFSEAVVRIMVAMAHADVILNRRVLETYNRIIAADSRLKHLKIGDFKQMIREQSCIMSSDPDRAVNALATLIPDRADQAAALDIARQVAMADGVLGAEEENLLGRIGAVLKQANDFPEKTA